MKQIDAYLNRVMRLLSRGWLTDSQSRMARAAFRAGKPSCIAAEEIAATLREGL